MTDLHDKDWRFDETMVLRSLVAGTAGATGEGFLQELVRNLAAVLGVRMAWVTEYLPERDVLRARAMWVDGNFVTDYEHVVPGTPCELVMRSDQLVQFPDNVLALFGHDPDVRAHRIVSYIGEALRDVDGRAIGHLAAMDPRPMADDERLRGIFRLFAARAAAELRRLEAERALREREEQLARLVGGTMDGIIELDEGLAVSQCNPAACMLLGEEAERLRGRPLPGLLDAASRRSVAQSIAELGGDDESRVARRIPARVLLSRSDGGTVPVEVGLARCPHHGRTWHILILRDLRERERAESDLRDLRERAASLEEELAQPRHDGSIVGSSPALLRVLEDVRRVADTDATVLVLGESGTGKELIARAVHRGSRRADKPFVTVNCAALPSELVESELFGHERGAFTGALRRREGRFALAHCGTIFLDEIGELPADAQAKLLRVLQDGSIEPIGGTPRRVDVRVVAATNRDLGAMSRAGRFREDLYYRLNVIPLRLPALRERREDIPLLAQFFADRCARRLGRRLAPFDAASLVRLQRYDWPGNVRELEHVIDRAAILARGQDIDLDQALPAAPMQDLRLGDPDRILRSDELRALERRNIESALERCSWRIAGVGGAAELLGIPPSTLASQMKAFGIQRQV